MLEFFISLFLNPLFFVCFFIGIIGIFIANEPDKRTAKKKRHPK